MSSKWIHYPGWVVGCYQLFDQTMDQLDYISPVAFMCDHFRYAWTWQHLQKEGRWNVCQLKLYRCFHCCQTNPAFSWLCEYNCAKNDQKSQVWSSLELSFYTFYLVRSHIPSLCTRAGTIKAFVGREPLPPQAKQHEHNQATYYMSRFTCGNIVFTIFTSLVLLFISWLFYALCLILLFVISIYCCILCSLLCIFPANINT